MYGSSFKKVTRKPRCSISSPSELAAKPFPKEETTPPVTKINFACLLPAMTLRSTSGRVAHVIPRVR
jgi:hypothetical protein